MKDTILGTKGGGPFGPLDSSFGLSTLVMPGRGGNLTACFSVVVVVVVVEVVLLRVDVDVLEVLLLLLLLGCSGASGLKPGGRRPPRSSVLMSPNRLARSSLNSVFAVVVLVVVLCLVVVLAVVASAGGGSGLKPGGRKAEMSSNFRFCRLYKMYKGIANVKLARVRSFVIQFRSCMRAAYA